MNLFAVFPEAVSSLTETRFLILGTLALFTVMACFPEVEYQLGTALITFLSTDFDRLRAKLRERQTPMMENAAITEVKNELSAAHPFLECFC